MCVYLHYILIQKVLFLNSFFFNFFSFQMIIDTIDPLNQNYNGVKDQFLGNMYRIVSIHSKFNMFLFPFVQSHKKLVSRFKHTFLYVLQIKSNFWNFVPIIPTTRIMNILRVVNWVSMKDYGMKGFDLRMEKILLYN